MKFINSSIKLNNRENECVETTDGRKIFVSRSVAVIPIVICSVVGDQDYVLLNKRGPACPDHVGKWTLPCGYIDWDESGSEAAIREIWEECGFDATKAISPNWGARDFGLLDDKPWDVTTAPSEDPRQNILLHYALNFVSDELPPVNADQDKANEVTDVAWVSVEEAMGMELAFNHQDRIAKYRKRKPVYS